MQRGFEGYVDGMGLIGEREEGKEVKMGGGK